MSDETRDEIRDLPDGPGDEEMTGLSEPGSGPEHHGRIRASEAPTRSRMALYDRVKLSLGIVLLLLVLALAGMSTATNVLTGDQVQTPFSISLERTLERYWWLLALLGLELLRQVHYLVSEHWSRYHRFWRDTVFGGWNRRLDEMNDWTRYRLGRVVKWVVRLAALDLILAAIVPGATPANALFAAPAAFLGALPQILQLAFAFFFIAFQFIGLFWLLSRGGTETYFPDDIETRFTDVWGQDRVLEKVRENMIFLEDPESIEDKGGYVPGGILLWGPPGTGKTLMAEAVAGETGKPYIFVEPGAFAQPLTAGVLTPGGWRKMGELAVGDEVIGRDGRPHAVLGVYPQGPRPILEVTFSDEARTRVTPEHLWAVQSPGQREAGRNRWQVVETRDMIGRLRRSRKGGWRYSVPIVAPVQHPHRDVPVDPYVLGALLGDGALTAGSIVLVNDDPRLVARVAERLPKGMGVRGDGPRYRIVGTDDRGRHLRDLLAEVGLGRQLAHEKSVPDRYLVNDVDTRLELLRGLMDTDGAVTRTASGNTHTTFGTSSAALRDGVIDLVRSLGGTSTWSTRDPDRGSDWQRLPFHDVNIYLPASVNPFGVKADRVVPRRRAVRRYVTGIEEVGVEDARCILVDAPDHLYVTDDHIVTHNTNMFFGVGILKVKSLFRKARKLALRYGGVIMFMDEADALGNRGALAQGGPPGRFSGAEAPLSGATCNGLGYLAPQTASLVLRESLGPSAVDVPRSLRERFVMGAGMGGGGGMGTLQALLTEISGLKKPRGFVNRYVRRALGMRPKPPPKYRILLMMASNMPEALDEALLRPGRIDRIYKVGYPSKEGRIRTYNGYLEKVSHRLTDEEVERLATITPYATGATIKDMVNEALINTIRRGADAIEWQDIVKAKHLKELGPPEDVEYIERERHAVAVHEACHAVVAYRVRHHLTIDIATIEKGGTYLGMVASIPPEDQFTRWRSEYEADIMVSIASLAGERMFFSDDNSSGVSGDLHSATSVAIYMEGFWGMGSTIASFGAQRLIGLPGGGGPGRPGNDEEKTELLKGNLGERIEAKLAELYDRTWELLERERRTVLAVAHLLETHKTVTGQDLAAVIDGVEGPLVDGRPYHDRGFLDDLERYHEQARSAHEEHGPVLVPLPRVPGGDRAASSRYDVGVADDQIAGATSDADD